MESQRQANLQMQIDRQSTRCSTGPNEEGRQLILDDTEVNNQQIQSEQSQQPISTHIVDLPQNNQIVQTEPQIDHNSPQNTDEQHNTNHHILPSKVEEQESKEDYDADDEASHPSYRAASSLVQSNPQLQQANNIVQPSHSEDEQSNLLDSHKDEPNYSQETNLLNFGFSLQEPMVIQNPKVGLEQIPHDEQENIPIQSVQKASEQFQGAVSSNEHLELAEQSQDPKYKVEVISCPDTNDKFIKNNDIYSSNQHNSTNPPNQRQSPVKQQQNQHQTRKQQQISHQPEQEEPSLLKIISSIKDLLQSQEHDDQNKFRIAMNILQDHIEHIFLKHITPIGQAFLTDGQLAILYIEAAILRQPTLQFRKILHKYMIACLSSKIQVNKQAFSHYKKDHATPSEKSSKSNSQPTEKQSHDPYRYSEVGNASVEAQDGSEIKYKKKNLRTTKKMQIDDPDNRPIKRTVLLVNRSANTTQLLSPKMGKETRRKHIVNSNAQQSHTDQGKSKNILAQSRSKANKSQIKNTDYSQQNQHLGSGYTYATLVNRRKSQKRLVQVRRSERLLAKQLREKQVDQFKIESVKKQTKKSARKSLVNKSLYTLIDSGKKGHQSENQEQKQNRSLLKVDYLKQHFKEIVVNVSMMERDYPAHTENDRKITQLLHELEKQEQSSRDLIEQGVIPPLSRVDEDYNEPQPQENADSTVTLAFDPSQDPKAIEARRRQFKKQLHKYILHEAVVKKVIDCDINGHGIYALLQFAPISQLLHGAKYALTPITNLQYANRRNIQKDIDTAKQKVGDERQNIAFVQLNSNILKMIEEEALRLNKPNPLSTRVSP